MNDLLQTLPCGVMSFTDDGTVVFANATLADLLGYTVDELEGRNVESLLTIAGRIFWQTHLFPMLRLHGKADEIFLLLRRKDATELGALMNARRRERNGVVVNDCVLLEVRERRKYEDELLRAKRTAESTNVALETRSRELVEVNARLELQQRQLEEQAVEMEAQSEELQSVNEELMNRSADLEAARRVAEGANRAKSQFLATMSHELRTPLNAIGGYVQLIELGIHGEVTDAQREALSRIARSQRHLLRLINDLLNLARIESGRVEYKDEDVRIADVVASVTPMVEPQLHAAQLTFASVVAHELVAIADRERVQQILINLLTNAVKFTPSGGRVTIDARRDSSGDLIYVRVSDTGIGIGRDKLESIFEPFVQVDAEQGSGKEGTGLGLAISRDLARGMGGDLRARSVEGSGSTFTLTLPAHGDRT